MEENYPLISICMPAYNAGKYVTEAVNSIINQSHKNWELIIVNDGSTDNTSEKLKVLDDARIKIFYQANQGQSAAANFAFSKSSGNLIKFMDADDLLSPTFIEEQLTRIGNRNDVIVSAAWGRFYNDDLSTFKLSDEKVWQDLPPQQWLIYSWINANAMMQCALWLIPRQVLNKAGLWNPALSLINDLDFFSRVILSSKMVLFQKNAVLYYRSGISGSLSDQKQRQAVVSAFKSKDNATGNLLAVCTTKEAKLACANTWQSFIYTTYPKHLDLVNQAQFKVDALGGSTLKFMAGGVTKVIIGLIGWKITKRLKQAFNIG